MAFRQATTTLISMGTTLAVQEGQTPTDLIPGMVDSRNRITMPLDTGKTTTINTDSNSI